VITHVPALLLQGFQLLCRREVMLGFLFQRVPSMGSTVTKVGPAGEGGDARRSPGGLSKPGPDSGSIARMTIRLSVRVRAKIDKRRSWTGPDNPGRTLPTSPGTRRPRCPPTIAHDQLRQAELIHCVLDNTSRPGRGTGLWGRERRVQPSAASSNEEFEHLAALAE
jgi:hypothetical protein